MDILDSLSAEHRIIEKAIELADYFLLELLNDRRPEKKDFDLFLDALSFYVEKFHHGKEEDILFPAIAPKAWINQGGPKCSFFMGLRMDFNPLEEVRKRLKIEGQEFELKFEKLHLNEWMEHNHPLSIPLEEHIYGHQLLLHMKKSDTKTTSLAKSLSEYIKLIRLHIRKEDECLFIAIRQNVPENELYKMHEQSLEFEKNMDEQRIRQALDIFAEFKAKYLKNP